MRHNKTPDPISTQLIFSPQLLHHGVANYITALCGHYITQLGAIRPIRQGLLLQLAFPKKGETADPYTTKSPSPSQASEVFSNLSVSCPQGPGSGASDLDWTGKGVRVCAQKSINIPDSGKRHLCVSERRITPKLFFFSLTSMTFHVRHLLGLPEPWTNLTRLSTSDPLPFQHPETPYFQFANFSERNV